MSHAQDARVDRAEWELRCLERGSEFDRAPSSWVIDRCLGLPPSAVILDVAGGAGRHAAPLAERGRAAIVVDFVYRAVASAVARHQRILGVVADAQALPIRAESIDAIV